MRSRRITFLVTGLLLAGGCDAGSPGAASTVPTPAPVSTVGTTTAPPVSTSPPSTTAPVSVPTLTPDDPAPSVSTTVPPPPTTTTTTTPPLPPPPNDAFSGLRLGLDVVAPIEHPTAVAWRERDDAMYVTTQDGLVLRVLDGETSTVLDLTAQTSPYEPGSERGLLGLAFDPRDGRMFLDYTDVDFNTHVVSYALDGGIADRASRREYLFIEQPGLGHNGGRLLFDDDANLYIGSGDGGGSNGRDAQDVTKLLGVIMRIIPDLDGPGYEIPADNPFADGVADRPEVWARGFRNPWTFSLDRATGDLWIGDVGNDEREEIDLMRAGESGLNFGWYWFEGTNQRRNNPPEGLTPPVYDYPRSDGVAVMGGYVYRGQAIPELEGAYLFADLGGPIWGIGASGVSRLDVERVTSIVGWGEDPDGELYVLSLSDGVHRLVRR